MAPYDLDDDNSGPVHAIVDAPTEEINLALAGEAGDVVAALEALDARLDEAVGRAEEPDDPADVLRAAIRDRAAAAAASHGEQGTDAAMDVGPDVLDYVSELDQQRDADRDAAQDAAAGYGVGT